uniref:ATP synthase subunit b', chloroplastic n=1 Tax=Isochrysis galbana TaxID=37099 RepID=A0A7D5B8Q1_ISOGA|nr:ATP synthase CF0 beta' subunit [Isochrysis galbana]QKW88461.1 ATP synthase CF0 beta' subunit [Isochrysis galbana]
MNNLIMSVTKTVTLSEAAGGLFDFNATLPLEALQFILLTVLLTFIFYKPIGQLLEERETFISGNLTQASEKLLKADELCQQYEQQLKEAKTGAQEIIVQAEREAKEIVAQEINQARADAASLIDQTNKELEAEKKIALQQLESQIDELSDLIKEKVLGKITL